jgi:hypothetical protein
MSPSKGDRPPKKRKDTEAKAQKRKTTETKQTPRGPDDELLAELQAAGIDVGGPTDKPGPVKNPPPRPPLDNTCEKLLVLVRQRCPGLLPADPLPPSGVTAPVPIDPKQTAGLITIAARQAVLAATGARLPSDPAQLPSSVLWQDGADTLLVEVAGINVQVGDGLVSVTIPVQCDQLLNGRDVVIVDLVLGTPGRPTGMLAAATEPRGPRVVVRRWGEALLALAWQALLDTAGGVAGAAGTDQDGAVLIPTGLTASQNGLAIIAQARHPFDRIRPGQVVGSPRVGGTLR